MKIHKVHALTKNLKRRSHDAEWTNEQIEASQNDHNFGDDNRNVSGPLFVIHISPFFVI